MAQSNTKTKLPSDEDSTPIQVLAPVEPAAAPLTLSGASDRVALPSGSEIVELYVSGACHLRFGTSSVNAATSDFGYPAGFVGTYKVPLGATHIAGVFAVGTTAAILYIRRLV